MVRSLSRIQLLTGAVALTCATSLSQTTIERIDVDSGGAEGDGETYLSAMSADSRFVAFESTSGNLVAGDTNGASDIFVHDRATGVTTRISVDSSGQEGDNDSFAPTISDDGRFVAFTSYASNLVVGDTNGFPDVFLHDRATATTTRLSVGPGGAESNSKSFSPSISGDGRYVAFQSHSSNLVAGDTNGADDIFLLDRTTGVVTRASVDSFGAESDDYSYAPTLARDGSFVAFESDATNLIAADGNGLTDVFVHEFATGSTIRVSQGATGAEGDDASGAPTISANGRYVGFWSGATNFATGDIGGFLDAFVYDRATGALERVSEAPGGLEADNHSGYGGLGFSADGRFVAYQSDATNLGFNDGNNSTDVFVLDRLTGALQRVSEAPGGLEADGSSAYQAPPLLSHSGREVVFHSDASNLVSGDTNALSDLFVATLAHGAPAVFCKAGVTSNGCVASIFAIANPSVSGAAACLLHVATVEGQRTGFIFYGVSGAAALPWGAGSSLLCVKTPMQRTGLQLTGGTNGGCDGALSLDWDAYQASHPAALGQPWSVGERAYAQAWFRDPPASKSTSLSDALELEIEP